MERQVKNFNFMLLCQAAACHLQLHIKKIILTYIFTFIVHKKLKKDFNAVVMRSI